MNSFLKFFLIVLAGFGVLYTIYTNNKISFKNPVIERLLPKISPAPLFISQKNEERYVFVPYWSFDKNLVTNSENRLIYFGLGVDENGVLENDKGFENMENFSKLVTNSKEKILAIRMTDGVTNAQIIKNREIGNKIASSAVENATKYGFESILLDFETSAFAFDSTINNISDFYTLFAEKVKDRGLKFYITLYGDNYIRARAYDVKKIGGLSDKVFVMTYDFHKSRGNPGPNFPLVDNRNYGYDLSKMISDFQKEVDNSKIVVILGYFGYDWKIDKDLKAVTSGVPLSTNEIKKEFVDGCSYTNCELVRDSDSLEPSVIYRDEDGSDHIIWFEDQISVDKKIEYLKSRGILEIGYWAYSYY